MVFTTVCFQCIFIPNFSTYLTIDELDLSLMSTSELTITPLLINEIAVSYAESLFVNKYIF